MKNAKQRLSTALLLLAAAATAVAAPPRLQPGLELLNNKLVDAVRDGDIRRMSELLDSGAGPNTKDAEGNPVLMLSALYAGAPAMQLLLEHGADPNATNAAKANALHWSAGDPAKARLLIARGANVNARSAPGRTPLAIAAAQDGNFEVVRMMVLKGASIEAHDNLEGFIFTGGGNATPLIEAAKTRDPRTVRFLLDRGANVNATDHVGGTALTEAVIHGSVDIVSLLLERGADVNHKLNPPFEYTALHLAAMRASTPLIDLLLAAGAKVDAVDGGGSTPLMWASYSETMDPAPVARLIKAGAPVEQRNKMGDTAVVWASHRGASPVVALLRNAGATSEAPVTSAASIPTSQAPALQDAITRSLAVLDKGGPQFFKVSGCVSCHNQTLPLIASALARRKNVQPDTAVEQLQLKSVIAFVKPATEIIAENTDVVPDLPVTGSNILMAFAAQNYAPDMLTAAIVQNIAARQLKDGSWVGVAPRPPLEAGDIQATALSVRALVLYGPPGRKAEFDARLAHAREWLKHATAITTEDKVMRLAGLAWARAGKADIRPATEALIADQRPDGGWGQLSTLPGDSYATGHVLVVLHESANISAGSDFYRRGIEYLLQTQMTDGSWLVKTRSFPLQPYKESGFPHGRDQWISAAGTSWAAMALSYAAEPLEVASR